MEMALRTSDLLLPEGFVEMDCEEMMYVDGGGTISLTLTGKGIIGIIASAFLKMFIRSGISAAIVAANMAVHAPFTALNAAFGGTLTPLQVTYTIVATQIIGMLISKALAGLLNNLDFLNSYRVTISYSKWWIPFSFSMVV